MVDLSTAMWRKRRHGCVEGASVVRDAKDRGGPVLLFSGHEWKAFPVGTRVGAFEPPR